MEKIELAGDDGELIELFVLEGTRLGGQDYILAADSEAGDGDCYILKDVSAADEQEARYEFVEDEKQLDYLLNIFTELLEDVDIEF